MKLLSSMMKNMCFLFGLSMMIDASQFVVQDGVCDLSQTDIRTNTISGYQFPDTINKLILSEIQFTSTDAFTGVKWPANLRELIAINCNLNSHTLAEMKLQTIPSLSVVCLDGNNIESLLGIDFGSAQVITLNRNSNQIRDLTAAKYSQHLHTLSLRDVGELGVGEMGEIDIHSAMPNLRTLEIDGSTRCRRLTVPGSLQSLLIDPNTFHLLMQYDFRFLDDVKSMNIKVLFPRHPGDGDMVFKVIGREFISQVLEHVFEMDSQKATQYAINVLKDEITGRTAIGVDVCYLNGLNVGSLEGVCFPDWIKQIWLQFNPRLRDLDRVQWPKRLEKLLVSIYPGQEDILNGCDFSGSMLSELILYGINPRVQMSNFDQHRSPVHKYNLEKMQLPRAQSLTRLQYQFMELSWNALKSAQNGWRRCSQLTALNIFNNFGDNTDETHANLVMPETVKHWTIQYSALQHLMLTQMDESTKLKLPHLETITCIGVKDVEGDARRQFDAQVVGYFNKRIRIIYF